MTVTEILQFVDHLVFTKTNKHLDDLQKKIIKEVFQGKTYKEIADFYDYDEGYIGDESRKIFKVLSEKLGEDINKNNFCWTLERVINSQLVNIVNGNVNLCPNHQFLKEETINKNQTKTNYYDLILAPQIFKFYNRETELKTIYDYIFKQNIRLISVLGLSGIGKTYLVKRFIDLNLDQFDVIIWKSLKFPKTLDLLVNDILNTCNVEKFDETSLSKSLDDQLIQLFTIFKEKRCLIILDDLQNIFKKGEFAGQYKTEFQNYQDFLTRIIETQHQSNMILISQEECDQMYSLDDELEPIKSLNLSGLDDINILKNTGLKDEASWLKLINLYEGNFFYLKSISMLINKNYDGKVTEFLTENCSTGILPINDKKILPVTIPVITIQMQSHFKTIFNNLSLIEQTIILQLSKSETPIAREDLRENLELSLLDFNNALQSLQQRYLVIKIKEDQIMFKLSSLFKEYVILVNDARSSK